MVSREVLESQFLEVFKGKYGTEGYGFVGMVVMG